MKLIKIGLVNDHKLFTQALAKLLAEESDFKVILEAHNGQDLINKLDHGNLPDIVITDIEMPIMDGIATTAWLRDKYPEIKVLVLVKSDDSGPILSMVRLGVKGFLLKDADATELFTAIKHIAQDMLYYPEFVTRILVDAINIDYDLVKLNSREVEFLKLASTELTYKEIADQMRISSRAVDSYRDQLFEKLQIKSRIGLVLYAIKHKLIDL